VADVTGNNDGLVANNSISKKVEPLVTVEKLKNVYLFGITIRDEDGNDLPDETYQQYIDNAVSMMEHYLDISIAEVQEHVEHRDYRITDYYDWGYYQLNNYPVICVRKLELVYFRDQDGAEIAVQEIPTNWIRLQNHDGLIRLVPNAKFPSKLQLNQAGTYFPEILRAQYVPHAWKFTYDYGFETGKIPALLNMAIAQIAAIQALTIAGNLVLGAGIAGSSISLDGLSQSIQTTQSAENSAYSATIKDYGDKLFGKTKDDPFALLKILKNFYKGQEINII
jgi:hypothetical protein